jgi:hypothetical protein
LLRASVAFAIFQAADFDNFAAIHAEMIAPTARLPEGQKVQANVDHTHDECPQNQDLGPAQVFHKPSDWEHGRPVNHCFGPSGG